MMPLNSDVTIKYYLVFSIRNLLSICIHNRTKISVQSNFAPFLSNVTPLATVPYTTVIIIQKLHS